MDKCTPNTEYRQLLRQRILEVASHEFSTRGVRQVKMDDIACVLSISKRTLYEIYDCKEDLLMECIKMQARLEADHMEKYSATHPNVLDNFLEFYSYKIKKLSETSILFFMDLQRYKGVVDWIRQRDAQRQDSRRSFFEEGVRQGYFRGDVDYQLISEIGNAVMDLIMSKQLYRQRPFIQLFDNLVLTFIRGICTPTGVEELDRRLQLFRISEEEK